MSRRLFLRRYTTFLLVATVLSCAWVFRPYETCRDDEVVPELRLLKEPFQSLETGYFSDGGSVGIRIVDADKREAFFSMPPPSAAGKYERLFTGGFHYTDAGVRELADPQKSMIRILQILREYPGVSHERDIVIATVSGRWRDYAKIYFRQLVSRAP